MVIHIYIYLRVSPMKKADEELKIKKTNFSFFPLILQLHGNSHANSQNGFSVKEKSFLYIY